MARRTKEEALATRMRILDAAELEFHRRGVARTSLQDIAAAAGLTRGAIYWHFKGKADLFDAMMQRVVLPLEAQIDRSADPALPDPLAHIRRSVLAALHAAVHDPQARRVFEIAMQKVAYVDEMQAVHVRRLQAMRTRVQHMEQAFRRAARAGQLRGRVPARAAAIGLFALAGGLIQDWMLDPEGFDLERAGRQALDAYLRGLSVAADVPPAALPDDRPALD